MEDKGQLSRRGMLAATAAATVSAGTAVVVGEATTAAAAAPVTGAAPAAIGDGFSTQAVAVNFGAWGTIYIGPGEVQSWWFTWYFSSDRWSRFSAMPTADSPAGSSIQIVTEWANAGTLNVQFRNNGSVGVVFRPVVIVAPA